MTEEGKLVFGKAADVSEARNDGCSGGWTARRRATNSVGCSVTWHVTLRKMLVSFFRCDINSACGLFGCGTWARDCGFA